MIHKSSRARFDLASSASRTRKSSLPASESVFDLRVPSLPLFLRQPADQLRKLFFRESLDLRFELINL